MAVSLTRRPVKCALTMLVVVTNYGNVLALTTSTTRRVFLTVFCNCRAPIANDVRSVNCRSVPVIYRLPILNVFLTIRVNLNARSNRLLTLIPRDSLMVTITSANARGAVSVVSIQHATSVSIQLPSITAHYDVTVLRRVLTLVVSLIITNGVDVSTRRFVTSLGLLRRER